MFKKGENTISGQMKIFQGRTDPNKYWSSPRTSSNNSKKMSLYKLLNMFLYGVLSMSNVLPMWV
jgi:hypothetical protein